MNGMPLARVPLGAQPRFLADAAPGRKEPRARGLCEGCSRGQAYVGPQPHVDDLERPRGPTILAKPRLAGVGSAAHMSSPLSDETLDAILAVQLTVAWAGEGRCAPRRLGWWDTDLIDDASGGDFLARLLPQTHAWAALEAVREAARRTDAKVRAKMAEPDKVRTLFFLGFEVDEQVGDRIAFHKRSGVLPAQALRLPLPLTASFSKDELVSHFSDDVSFTTVPNGRQVKGKAPASPELVVQRLSAALIPLADQYPLPFFAVGG